MRAKRMIVVFLLALPASVPAANAAPPDRTVIGHSVEGRPIVTWHQGRENPDFKVLVVGSIHGDERQGMRVVAQLRRTLIRTRPKGIGVWSIRTSNPDGTVAGTRKNSRGVDLNRNFPFRWDGNLSDGYYSGPRPASEPETRAVMALTRRVGFDLAIWFHQPWGRTLAPCNSDRRWAYLYARLSGLGAGGGCDDPRRYPGSAASWQRHARGTVAFAVEFGPGVRPKAAILRHAKAVIRLARRMR